MTNPTNNDAPNGAVQIQWHPDLHRDWGEEQLHFMRLGFAPIYQRDKIKTALLALFAEQGVTSYVCYELLGVYDVMLRVWLPKTTTQQAFRDSVRQILKPANMITSDSFAVFRQARNWLWEGNATKEIAKPNATLVHRGPPTQVELDALRADPALFARYEKDNLIRRVPHNSGIKFFMVLPAPAHLSDDALDNLYSEVGRALDEVNMLEYSLYTGQGFGSGTALIMGRVAFSRFYDIGNQLGAKILGRLAAALGVRTYTFPASSDAFLCYAESVPGADSYATVPGPHANIQAMLEGGETQWVEIKGSAFVPLKPLFEQDVFVESPNNDATKSFQRAVTGLLNASGGTVILGAIEQGRFADQAVRKHFGDYIQHGHYLCVGLDSEIEGDRDAFEQRLRHSLASHVKPLPPGAVEVEFVELAGRTLVLLRVRPSEIWHYYDGREFVVRDGNGSETLNGPEGDLYRKAHRRDGEIPVEHR